MNSTHPRASTGLLLALALCLLTSAALAQEAKGGIADSGMEQGEALINIRSDVRVSIKGAGGTKQAHLEQLAEVLTGHITAMRKCYGNLVKKRPATIGGMTIKVAVEGKKPKVAIEEHGGSDRKLTSCIRKIVEKERYKNVSRPAAAIVTLEFTNTRAQGQSAMNQHRQAADAIEVTPAEGGGFEASYATPDKRVAFHVHSKRSEKAVAATLSTLKSSFAAFLDCRRRAAKDGLSPAGDVELNVRLMVGSKANGKVKSRTVAHERVEPCVERAFRRLKFKDAPAGRNVRVKITYSE